MVTLPELLLAMLIVVGDALMEKPGVAPVTVRNCRGFNCAAGGSGHRYA